MIGHNKNDVRL